MNNTFEVEFAVEEDPVGVGEVVDYGADFGHGDFNGTVPPCGGYVHVISISITELCDSVLAYCISEKGLPSSCRSKIEFCLQPQRGVLAGLDVGVFIDEVEPLALVEGLRVFEKADEAEAAS